MNMNKEQLQDLQTWYEVDKRMASFANKYNLLLSIELFGDEGERLFRDCFSMSCNRDFKSFLTYLTKQQNNLLLDTIMTDNRFNP